MAHGLGLLLVQNSLGLTAPEAGADGLFLQYLDRMAARLQLQGSAVVSEVKSGEAASQSALFG
jgi:hypothetical protein